MTRARWTDSDPELRDLLAKAKRIDAPPESAKMRVAGLVQASIAGGSMTAAHAAKVAGAAAKGGAAAGAVKGGGVALLGAKGIAALACVVAVGGGVAVVVHSMPSHPTRELVVAAHVAPLVSVSAPRAGPVGAPAVRADVPRAADVPFPAPPLAARSAVIAAPAPPAVLHLAPGTPGADEPPRRSELAEERALLDPARAALARGDAVSALAATRVHEQRFANGALTEEREAIGIQALVLEGRLAEARARAARFAERHPDSLVLPAILASLPVDASVDH